MVASAKHTTITVTNNTSSPVQTWITLGATPGCVPRVSDLPFVTTAVNTLQGYFTLAANGSVSYTSASGVGLNGNVTFGSPPLNCPTSQFPTGINVAEFIVNNSFQGPGAQETIDISAVAGVNALIEFTMSGGGQWNAGSTEPNVTAFQNKALGQNVGQVGVFPYKCDDCTSSVSPPSCPGEPLVPVVPQSSPICNVQRDASTSGGTVTITLNGLLAICAT